MDHITDCFQQFIDEKIKAVAQIGGSKTMKTTEKSVLIVVLVIVVVLGSMFAVSAFSNKQNTIKLQQLEYGKPVIVTIAWNNRIYKVTNEKISENELGQQTGSVTRQVSPRPDENGEIARNTPEGPMLIQTDEGIGYLYQIHGYDQKYKIALERSEGIYTICEYYCRLG
jgi:hypothetical protein